MDMPNKHDLPPIPYPDPQVKEIVRRHNWGDTAQTIFENMREHAEQSRKFAGASAPPIVWFLAGWEAAWKLAYAQAKYHNDGESWQVTSADAENLGDEVTGAIIPPFDAIIQSAIEKYEAKAAAREAKAALAKINGEKMHPELVEGRSYSGGN